MTDDRGAFYIRKNRAARLCARPPINAFQKTELSGLSLLLDSAEVLEQIQQFVLGLSHADDIEEVPLTLSNGLADEEVSLAYRDIQDASRKLAVDAVERYRCAAGIFGSRNQVA